jgi:hypothetical protein
MQLVSTATEAGKTSAMTAKKDILWTFQKSATNAILHANLVNNFRIIVPLVKMTKCLEVVHVLTRAW